MIEQQPTYKDDKDALNHIMVARRDFAVKKTKWINDNVKIEFPIYSEVLKNTIADCERYDREGNPQYFGMARAVDMLCKVSVANGHMSQRQWDTLVSRYPEW